MKVLVFVLLSLLAVANCQLGLGDEIEALGACLLVAANDYDMCTLCCANQAALQDSNLELASCLGACLLLGK